MLSRRIGILGIGLAIAGCGALAGCGQSQTSPESSQSTTTSLVPSAPADQRVDPELDRARKLIVGTWRLDGAASDWGFIRYQEDGSVTTDETGSQPASHWEIIREKDSAQGRLIVQDPGDPTTALVVAVDQSRLTLLDPDRGVEHAYVRVST
ncbi:hypothetical protein TTY48_23570 [Tsukamurella sp. TY48]|uniref:hypothetical protein n=1 Tax=Tsukamurella TaxID=2060 RepID=UPI001C7D6904|nr:hypothetical protein [Tsukamurella sp. TY48]GIZ97745.1 hypothetical protein TTY48_23570 [Tsukamurella sp. TY48]